MPMLLGILICATAASCGMIFWQSLDPQAISVYGITIDRLSAVLTFLVSMVGTVTFRFSLRYLEGEHDQRRFLNWLFTTVSAAYLLMLSTNLWLLFCAWLVVSVGLHQLLLYYPKRSEAIRPARKKFLISRLGDVALLGAICLIGFHWNTWDLQTFLAKSSHDPSATRTIVGLLIVMAALTKSAQFPFHSWLPETMEAPTPVSALMHAGIINAGGALLLRFAPLIITIPLALFLLTLVGTATACLGLLVMWAQPDVKRTLAWSTVSQMGFMMAECGLGMFATAALHIVGHGFYKAWSFLRSGERLSSSAPDTPLSPASAVSLLVLGTGISLPLAVWADRLTGGDPLHSPGEFALLLILCLSLGQVWITCFRTAPVGKGRNLYALAQALTLSLVLSLTAFALYAGANAYFAPVFGALPRVQGEWAWISALLPVAALAALCAVHALLPAIVRTRAGRAFHVHMLHGFYFGIIADQYVDRLWNLFFTEEKLWLISQ